MTKFKLQFNTNDMILYHLIQRFVYQYHSLFSINKTHPSLDDLTQLWYLKMVKKLYMIQIKNHENNR